MPVLVLAPLLAGCGLAVAGAVPSRHHSGIRPASAPSTVAPSRSTASTPPPTAPAVRPVSSPAPGAWVADGPEPYPQLKELAARVAVSLTTYDPAATPASVADTVTSDPGRRAALTGALGPLVHHGDSSSGAVVYPQMGGITADAASVMVVVRQTVSGAQGSSVETRTLDVWLVRSSSGWQFDQLNSAGGTPVPEPAGLSAVARAVLADPRISLPDTARWDIYRGAVSPVLLQLMLDTAQVTPYAVTVLETGHPYDVFGTGTESLHSAGRAVDIHALAGVPVVDQHAVGSPAYALARWLLGHSQVTQVGSPWALEGSSSRSFTNSVHLDHIHVSV